MFDLKIDEKFPHHYIISVGMRDMRSKNPGQMYLKHGPLYFSNDDVKNVQGALILSKDRLFETTSQQAMKNFGCKELSVAIRGMHLAAMANHCTMHHFSSPIKLQEDWFEHLVSTANKSDRNRELLENSVMRHY